MVVIIPNDVLGKYTSIQQLRLLARHYAAGKIVNNNYRNDDTGNLITVNMSGVKHTMMGAMEDLLKTIPVIPEILKNAKLIETRKDKHSDPNVLAIEIYKTIVSFSGLRKEVIVTVKQFKDGRRYYDHGIINKNGRN